MPKAIVGRWGKNLAVRFPSDIVEAAGLADGERVDVETRDGEIVIRRARPHFAIEALFEERTAAAWRAEYAGAYDWGPDIGREAVDE